MMRGSWKLALLVMTVAAAVCTVGMLVGAGEDVCYSDVIVTGAGTIDFNGTYEYVGMQNDRPVFASGGGDLVIHYDGMWLINKLSDIYYVHFDDSATPPPSEWLKNMGPLPAPTLSGGEAIPCGGGDEPTPIAITINPTGGGGPESFLDAVLPLAEGEVAPMIGERPLAAIHGVGDFVTGGCQILGTSGLPTGASYVHVYIYSVDVGVAPEVIVLVDHWMASYNRVTREFEIAWDTVGLAPGYYDMRLSFPDGTSQTLRLQLI